MRIKLSVVLVVVFLLILTNCGLFEGTPDVNFIEPQEGDILVRGESFKVIADIDVDYKVSGLNVELWLPLGLADKAYADSVYHDTTPDEVVYDSILWVYHFSDEEAKFLDKLTIEKELTVPSNAPVDNEYRLEIGALNLEGGFYSGYSLPVRVRSSND